MKKYLCLAFCLMLTLALAACGGEAVPAEATETLPKVQIANPYLTLTTAEEMMEKAGFQATLPTALPDWVEETVFRTIPGELIEVIYRSEDNEIRVRIAMGDRDISGVYDTEHQDFKDVTVDEKEVHLKGIDQEDFLTFVSTWTTSEGRTYSVTSTAGVPESQLLPILEEIQ